MASSLLMLSDRDAVRKHIQHWMQLIADHKASVQQQFQQLGFVLPTRTFFENEERRYTNIFSGNTEHSKRLAAPRELLQNSSDAGTDVFKVSTLEIVSDDGTDAELCRLLECNKLLFVLTEDTGRWCQDEKEEGTYNKCMKYFLSMNGSGKSAKEGTDGGFGVGRLVVLFCAPFWVFTTRNLLVVGHFNQFRVICRRCFESMTGPMCGACQLRERDTPLGTTFLVHYKHFTRFGDLVEYKQLLKFGYYKFCITRFPVMLNGEIIEPYKRGVTIFRCRNFVVSKIEFSDAEEEQNVIEFYGCKYEHKFLYGMYLVRTAKGVPMFTKIIYSDKTEAGLFMVDLHESVTFNDFDQSRQTLQNVVGHDFAEYIAVRSNMSNSRDIDHDCEYYVSGVCDSLLVSVEAATTDRLDDATNKRSLQIQDYAKTRDPLLVDSATSDSSNEDESTDSSNVDVSKRSLRIQDYAKTIGKKEHWPGLLCYIMMFTGGRNVNTIERCWLPGRSWEQVYLLVLWTEVLNILLPSELVDNFCVGLAFSTDTEASVEYRKDFNCRIFFLDPENLQTSVMRLFDNPPKLPKEKMELTFALKSRRKLIAAVISDAVHEVTHITKSGHDAEFASYMNTIFTKTMVDKVYRKVLALDDAMRRASKRLFVFKSAEQQQSERVAMPTRKRKSVEDL